MRVKSERNRSLEEDVSGLEDDKPSTLNFKGSVELCVTCVTNVWWRCTTGRNVIESVVESRCFARCHLTAVCH